MTSDDYSCIENVEKIIHIVLPFSYAGNQTVGLKSTLDSWKFQYVQKLEGILIDYQNVTFMQSMGKMLVEQPYAHYDVKATFSVFKPRCGRLLKGVVNRISKTHVGCVVHKFFNVSIPLLTNEACKLTRFLVLDAEILFEITNVDAQRRVTKVSGKITPQCIELMKTLFSHWKDNKHHQYFEDDNNELNTDQSTVSDIDTSFLTIQSPPKQKKKKKSKHKDSAAVDDNSTSGFESLNLDMNNSLNSPKKGHKKKKKHKDDKELKRKLKKQKKKKHSKKLKTED